MEFGHNLNTYMCCAKGAPWYRWIETYVSDGNSRGVGGNDATGGRELLNLLDDLVLDVDVLEHSLNDQIAALQVGG